MKALEELGISHTPWTNNGVDHNPYGFVRIIDKDGFFVADVDGESDENQHANARLIAAAPKLYECLAEAIEMQCHDCKGGDCYNCQIGRWKDALAEASGEVSNG